MTVAEPPSPVLPDYVGACTSAVIPALLEQPDELPDWFPEGSSGAEQYVVLVLDGLGWEQFEPRRSMLPTLDAMASRAITTVAPSTTATALTSITTGVAPGEHGIVGYRMAVGRDVLNVLRWSTQRGDARQAIPPHTMCDLEPFGSQRPAIVTRAEFEHSGFTAAHLDRARFVGYRTQSTLAAEVVRLARGGEPFVYAYYDGIDKVAHEYGLAMHYDAELIAVEWMVEWIVDHLPRGAALVIIADHGQVDVGERIVRPSPEVMSHVDFQSGEGRFRWLHAMPGQASDLLAAAREHHSDQAWVRSSDEVIDEGWFGPMVTKAARTRLGDVALVAFEPVAFEEPTDTGPYELIGRHGSLTSAEMWVPLLVARP